MFGHSSDAGHQHERNAVLVGGIAGGGMVLERTDLLDPGARPSPDVSPGFLRRACPAAQRDQASINEVLSAIQVPDVTAHLRARLRDLKELGGTTGRDAVAAIEKRIRSARPLMPVRVGYAFDVGEFGLVGIVSGDDGVLGRRLGPVAPWPLALWQGLGPDALCGFAQRSARGLVPAWRLSSRCLGQLLEHEAGLGLLLGIDSQFVVPHGRL